MKRSGWGTALFAIALLCLGVGLIAVCGTLPSLENRNPSRALTDTDDTRLGRAIAPRVAAHPGRAGLYPLPDARDAFAARVLLAQAAERSLDVRYYIWRQDLSGTLLLEALHAAAERGVRVRLLLDDNGVAGLDATLAALHTHPNIEVRLFNPFVIRRPRWVNYLVDFPRLNRRMHNKSFTADNQATIIGGRNVGDEYFGAAEAGVLFVDLDVLAVGSVVDEVSRDFDRYWASASSYPVDRLLPPVDAAALATLAVAASLIERDPAAAAYVKALRETPFVHELTAGRLALEWAATRLVSDDPAKGLGRAAPGALVPEQLEQLLGVPETELQLISAYFVPAETGTEAFRTMAERGVDVKVLTNSLEATDVAVVHAGYAKRRRALLEAGVTLHERQRLSSSSEHNAGPGPFGSSGASLHAKTFAVDGARVFIGSFNFDPRSAKLNTEMGFVIDSPTLARNIAAAFEGRIPANAYRVRLSDSGDLYWVERRDGEVIRHDTEPGTSVWQRAGVWLLSLLPIDWLL